MAVVRDMLHKERRGSSMFGPLAGLVTFELFSRYFIDGESPPRAPEPRAVPGHGTAE